MKYFYLCFIQFCFLINITAQNKSYVSFGGICSNSDGHILPFGSVIIYNNEGAILRGDEVDMNGEYECSIGHGESAEFSYLGYESKIFSFKEISDKEGALDVTLEQSNTLPEIEILSYCVPRGCNMISCTGYASCFGCKAESNKRESLKNTSEVEELLTVFPNPSSYSINIKKKDFENGIIYIYDIEKQTIIEREISTQTIQVDISNWTKGIYFIRYTSDSNVTETQQLVKV